MSALFPISWMQLTVQKTSCQLKTNKTFAFETVCTWNGHHIALEQDPATPADIAGQSVAGAIADLKAGDQLQAKGMLKVSPLLNELNAPALNLCLHVYEIKIKGQHSDEKTSGSNDKTCSDESGGDSEETPSDKPISDVPQSDRPQNHGTSSHKSSGGRGDSDQTSSGSSCSEKPAGDGSRSDQSSREHTVVRRAKQEQEVETGDKRSSSESASDSDGSSEGELGEEIDSRRFKRFKKSFVKGSAEELSSDFEDVYEDNGSAGRDASFMVSVTASQRAAAGMAGSASRSSSCTLTRRRGPTIIQNRFAFNGRGQITHGGKPLQETHEPNLVFTFSQMFSDGSKRLIFVSTLMAGEESLDTLMVEESVHNPDGYLAWNRRMN